MPPISQTPDDGPAVRHSDYLYAVARRRLGGRLRGKVGASDVVQQALLRAHQHRDAFRGASPPELRGWLRRIVLRTIADAARRFAAAARDADREGPLDPAAPAAAPGPAADHTTPSQRAAAREESERLLLALAELPDDQRQAVVLRHLHGLSVAEVCARMGRSERAVAGLLQRGVRGLRRLMDEPGAGHEPLVVPAGR